MERISFWYNMTVKDHRGFTLVEVLVVIAVIGVLAALASTAYVGSIKKGERAQAYSNLQSLRLLEEQFFAENACYQPLVANACPATNATVVGASNIRTGFLPGFQPGGNPSDLPNYGLSFTYEIVQNMQINDIATPAWVTTLPRFCFVAIARGRAGTRVDGDIFVIDCNNNRNF